MLTLKIENKPLIKYVVGQVERVKDIDKIVVATTLIPEDNSIENACNIIGVCCHRWRYNRLLSQYYNISYDYALDTIIILHSNNPLIDPNIIERGLREFNSGFYDYCSNVLPRTYPHGYDVHVMSYECLEKIFLVTDRSVAGKKYKDNYRVHPLKYIEHFPHEFNIHNFTFYKDYSRYKLEINTESDLYNVSKMIHKCGHTCNIYDAIAYMKDKNDFKINMETQRT